MRRPVPFRWLVLAAILVASVGLMGVETTKADVWVIFPDDSINDAIDAASPGDTIILAEGTYYEEVLAFNKSNITVKGANSNVVIRPSAAEEGSAGPAAESPCEVPTGICVYTSSDVTFKQITVSGFSVGVGVILGVSTRIEDIRALDNVIGGIVVYQSIATTLYRNVTNNDSSDISRFGILAIDTLRSEIRLNRTEHSAIGIAVADSSDAAVLSNTARYNCAGIAFLEVVSSSINNNTSHNNTFACITSFEDIFDAGATLAGEQPADAADTPVYYNISGTGIFVAASENIEVKGNSLTGNRGYPFSDTPGYVTIPSGGIVAMAFDDDNNISLTISANFLRRNDVDINFVDADNVPYVSTGTQNRCRSSVQSIPSGYCNFGLTPSP
ncbi:MAG: NosD domain-containing protein [Dehalococcoidia bacterium]